jgi:hypothetical protein
MTESKQPRLKSHQKKQELQDIIKKLKLTPNKMMEEETELATINLN